MTGQFILSNYQPASWPGKETLMDVIKTGEGYISGTVIGEVSKSE